MNETRQTTSAGTSEDQRFVRLEATVDALMAAQKKTKPFFRDPAQIIAISAFIISIATAVHAYLRERSQDEQALKAQPRAAIIQSGDIGIKNEELHLKFKGSDPASLVQLGQWLGVQNTILARASI